MHYEFITTIATILLVGASIVGFNLAALRAFSRITEERFARIDQRFEKVDERFEKLDQRFEKIDERFEKIDRRFEKIDERFLEIQKQFTAVQEQFAAVHKEFVAVLAGIARLEGLIEGLRHTPAFAPAPQSAGQA